MELRLRRASDVDQPAIRRAVYQAWRWSEPWSESGFCEHLARGRPDSYVDDFGHRPGDVGFIVEATAASGDRVVGAAWYRFFTSGKHRAGFVRPDVPEVVVAVSERARGRGVGRSLTTRLVEQATGDGLPALSLHVSHDNTRAQRLYQALDFAVVDRPPSGLVMLRQLPR